MDLKKRKVNRDPPPPPKATASATAAPASTNESMSLPAAQRRDSLFSPQPADLDLVEVVAAVDGDETESEDEPHLARLALRVGARQNLALEEMVCTNGSTA